MRVFTIATSFQVLIAMTFIAGCGGGQAIGTSANLAGSWSEVPQSGHNSTLVISSNGKVSGNSLNFQAGGTDILTGTVQPNGSFRGSVQNDQHPSYNYSVMGTMIYAGDTNRLRVSYSGTVYSAPITTDVTFAKN